ncbi:hypothetical protein WICPIJ_004975 [Wickerhamomyces pijperi]|uniref:VPS10 domain-containing protein n=1 Tax=Wickerhamomyces pijperi TaxID=599730 RepID=A0A9P8Q4X6_WICPI|nr:hypothetical protein WICPIJ_004975 [Wickerhamomyces pijperi]
MRLFGQLPLQNGGVNMIIKTLLTTLLLLPIVINGLVIDTNSFQPTVHQTKTDSTLREIVYFDDSSNVLILSHDHQLSLSTDDGITWETKLENISRLHIDNVKTSRALAFSKSGDTHYVSNDFGNTWSGFSIGSSSSLNYEISVNAKNPDQVILGFLNCPDHQSFSKCQQDVYYTTDGFKSNPSIMIKDIEYCVFTKSNNVFDRGDDSRVLCLKTTKDPDTKKIVKSQVITSLDFFISEPQVVNDPEDILATNVVIEIEVIQSFIVVQVVNSDHEVLLFVSKDGTTFRKAHYDGEFKPKMFSFLASTKESLFISSWGSSSSSSSSQEGGSQVATVLASDSEGLNFRNILGQIEGNISGFLTFEKFEKVEGAWLANVFEGYDEYSYLPKTRSKVTFDDGRSWSYLKVTDDPDCQGDEQCSLNLLSLDERRGDGQGATGATPGILLGIGSTGDDIGTDLFAMKTYISRDGGITWSKTLDRPCVFAFGDLGNIIVTAPYVKQNDSTSLVSSELNYSLDQGISWQTFNVDTAVFPTLLTTAIDGSTSKFIYVGLSDSGGEIIYALDFEKAFNRVCSKEEDFEIWVGRTEANSEISKGTCIYGHKDVYKRRKQTADCFINKPYEDLKIDEVPCECSNYDFECNYGFMMNSKGECVQDHRALEKLCSDQPKSKVLKLETKRKIPGNLCKGGSMVSIPIEEITCDSLQQPNNGQVVVIPSEFEGTITQYVFLDHSTSENDETMIVKTSKNQVYISQNGGRDFTKFVSDSAGDSDDVQILEVYTNSYFPNNVYLFGTGKRLYVSKDRGYSFTLSNLPSDLSMFGLPSLTFNQDSQDTLIFYGNSAQCQDNSFSSNCKSMAYITENNGASWQELIMDVKVCDFVGARYTEFNVNKNLIYCQIINEVSTGSSLIASSDKFTKQKDILYGNIVGFASTTRFTIVAAIHEDDSLKAYVTVDGSSFAEALFPADFQINKQQAYTILGSETGAVFLHVTSNDRPGSEFGAILKSNTNGTSYVLSEKHVNRNALGFVDFERVEGMEGICIINTVSNFEKASDGALKDLVSKITFNDGADWDYLRPPSRDSLGAPYGCVGQSLKSCSLHLHGYTERTDLRDTFSSNSATGVLLGVGNVGDKLGSYEEAHTFLSSDGGLTWTTIAQSPYQWEFGDQGSIIVIIDNKYPQNWVKYSLNQGQTWELLQITEEPVKLDDIVTVPSDTSTRFVITTRSLTGDKSQMFTLDFANLFERDCILSPGQTAGPNNDDFEYWSPRQPFSSSPCLFGHEVQYLRKLPGRTTCKIGKIKLSDSHKKIRDCPCTRRDFECDFNYSKANDGTCKLVANGWTKDPQDICKVDSNVFEYFDNSGYRKIPMNTCHGGLELDRLNPKPCPGKKQEFDKVHGGEGISGSGWGLVVLVPLFVFFFAIWFVYDRGIRRNGGFQRFGEIRLDDGDDGLIENNNTDKVVNSIVRGGISLVAVVFALYQTVKAVDHVLIDRVKSVFRSRTRRSDGFGSYSNVDSRDFRDHEAATDIFHDENDYEADNFDIEDEDDFGDLSGPSSNSNSNVFVEEAEHQPFRDHEGDLGDVFGEYQDDRDLE